ncbi:MAG: DndE family protein [Bacteroidales bacterium]|nr:DndE family protein [Bacteroidales bacterium]
MLINLRTSEANHQIVKDLTNRLPQGTDENVIARIAITYSLSKNRKLKSENQQDSKGKEYKEHTLLGYKYKQIYVALICQNYQIHRDNPDIPKYFKLHLDDGLELINKIFEDNPNYSAFDFLLQQLDNGINVLENTEVSLDAVKNHFQNIETESYRNELQLEVGKNANGEPVVISPNNGNKYANCHIAVAGGSGQGKTQFALDLLSQFYENSNKQINFLYLDFKGLSQEDEQSEMYQKFFRENDTNFIDITKKTFPLNPLSFIDNVNPKNKILGINKFVDIIATYGKIGKNKEQILKEATKIAFEERANGEYPSFPDIFERVTALDPNVSTLRGILESLSELKLFEEKVNPLDNFINKNYYLSLSGDLPVSVRFTSTFLIINYIYNVFMNMENAHIENDCVAMRYVLLIDEAHTVFKDRKSQDILEKILREIRSKGVSIMLLSQGIEEFNQPNFDFSSMCEISFLLKIKDINNIKVINKFLGYSEIDGNKAKRSLEKIDRGKAITNIREFPRGELMDLTQYYKRWEK